MGRARSDRGENGVAALEARIAGSRDALAETVDAITERVAPKNVASVAKARARGIVVDDDGTLKKDKAAVIGGIVVVFVSVVLWRRFH